jgi:hypothetical protein
VTNYTELLKQCRDTAIESGAYESYKAVRDAFDKLQISIEALVAERDAIKSQEPVAIAEGHDLFWIAGKQLDKDADHYLYAAPQPAQQEPVAWEWFTATGEHKLTADEPADYELAKQVRPLIYLPVQELAK